MASRHPEHLPSFSYVGPHRYHLRFCTDAKRSVFTSDAPVDLVRAQILRSSEEQEFAVIVFCFMPDHVHQDETTAVVARYILENPIRAGLVTRVADYPFVGSLVYTMRELLESVQIT